MVLTEQLAPRCRLQAHAGLVPQDVIDRPSLNARGSLGEKTGRSHPSLVVLSTSNQPAEDYLLNIEEVKLPIGAAAQGSLDRFITGAFWRR